MRIYRIGLALMLVAMLAGPVSADRCEVTVAIPTSSTGATLTLDAVFVPVEAGADTVRVLFAGQPVVAGETLSVMVMDIIDTVDYAAECVLSVTYPSGQIEVVEWSCQAEAEWIGTPGCSCIRTEIVE